MSEKTKSPIESISVLKIFNNKILFQIKNYNDLKKKARENDDIHLINIYKEIEDNFQKLQIYFEAIFKSPKQKPGEFENVYVILLAHLSKDESGKDVFESILPSGNSKIEPIAWAKGD